MSLLSIAPHCQLETEEQEIHRLMNEFLDVYSLYLKTGLGLIKKEATTIAFQIHMLDPTFSCVI